MVEQRTLTPSILVRIQVPQPILPKSHIELGSVGKIAQTDFCCGYSKTIRLAGVGGIGLTVTPARPASFAISVSSLCL